jgi:hypothetical protein
MYVGQFQNGIKEGIGYYFWNKGGAYQGQFVDGNQCGYGFLVKRTSQEIYSGYWEKNRREGRGFEQWSDGSVYDGFYRNGRREGPGVMKYTGGVMYMGEWKAGKKEGLGRLEQRLGDNATYSTGKFFEDGYLSACEVNLKPLLNLISGSKVYKDFEVFLDNHSEVFTSFLDEFKVLNFGNIKKLERFMYPDLLKWLRAMSFEGFLDARNLGRMRNFLFDADNCISVCKRINTSFNGISFQMVENYHKKC